MPDHLPFTLIVLALGFVVTRYLRSRGRLGRFKKLYQLSDREIDLVGLASDTL